MLLSSVFSNDVPVTFICDDTKLIAWLHHKKFAAVNAKDLKLFPKNAIIVHSATTYLRKIDQMLSQASKSCVLSLNQLAFDQRFEALCYSCEKLLEVDFHAVFSYQKALLSKLESLGNPLLLNTEHHYLKCNFSENVHFAYPKELTIQPGQPRNVNEYLELHFENLNDSFESCFNLEGNIPIASILYAITPSKLKYFSNEIQSKAKQLFEHCANAENTALKFSNNKVTSFKIDNFEYIDVLYKLAGSKKGLEITEFAFGLNKGIKRNVNWSINSQLNEGIDGLHVGIGDGSSGIHLDFICTQFNAV